MDLKTILENNYKWMAAIASMCSIIGFYFTYFNPNILQFYNGLDIERKIQFVGLILFGLIISIFVYLLNRISKIEKKVK